MAMGSGRYTLFTESLERGQALAHYLAPDFKSTGS